MSEQQFSDKRYAIAVILSAIFGVLGFSHFYLGRWGHGLFDLFLTIGGLILISLGSLPLFLLGVVMLVIDGIHTFIVTIRLLIGEYRDGKGLKVPYPGQRNKDIEKVFD